MNLLAARKCKHQIIILGQDKRIDYLLAKWKKKKIYIYIYIYNRQHVNNTESESKNNLPTERIKIR